MTHDTSNASTGIVQFVPRPGILDLGPGYLEPALLPVAALRDTLRSAMAMYGPQCLGYGANRGPRPLLESLARLTAGWDGRSYPIDSFLVTGGTSQMLDHLAGTLAAPGDVVLTEATSYNFGCDIFRQHGLRLVPVDCDDAGMTPTGLHKSIVELRRAEGRIAFAYVIPTFHNPTGRLTPLDRRLELLDVTGAHRVRVVEDNAYRDIVLDDVAVPPSLLSLADTGVVQLSSFSKCLAPGLRLGWLTGDVDLVERVATSAMLHSGGCLNHVMALMVSELFGSGAFDRHVTGLRRALTARRDALLAGLRDGLPGGYHLAEPRGGFFVWLELPPGVTDTQVSTMAEEYGVGIVAGSRFAVGDAPPAVRLSFSFHPPADLHRAGQLIAAGCRAIG
ncbi:MAG TPA: aminotransferase class I/II-fold pyridoxal phosphate-dependent enzyme [Micromonosporaceae bacterium]|jgi:DNA-binding transcriptional MocR family regulator|nr:aminotransferase class I/II-fold pyridoxal phosphate-dependent enzyme [Micromonosporaceae bacterium]